MIIAKEKYKDGYIVYIDEGRKGEYLAYSTWNSNNSLTNTMHFLGDPRVFYRIPNRYRNQDTASLLEGILHESFDE